MGNIFSTSSQQINDEEDTNISFIDKIKNFFNPSKNENNELWEKEYYKLLDIYTAEKNIFDQLIKEKQQINNDIKYITQQNEIVNTDCANSMQQLTEEYADDIQTKENLLGRCNTELRRLEEEHNTQSEIIKQYDLKLLDIKKQLNKDLINQIEKRTQEYENLKKSILDVKCNTITQTDINTLNINTAKNFINKYNNQKTQCIKI